MLSSSYSGFVNSSASYIGTETFVCRGRRKLSFQDRQEGGHYTCTYTYFPRKIRLIECNAKCRYLNKLTSKGTFQQVFFLSEARSPPMIPYSPPHAVYVYTVHLFTHGSVGGELTKEKVRGAIVHKAGRKYQHD